MTINEPQIEGNFISKLEDLKYTYRPDIRDKASLEKNFREKFQALNKVNLTDTEYLRLRDEIIDSDVFAASKKLREINTFFREDGTPLQYTLVNIRDWCKNEFEIVNQLRINTDNSHHRYDVILLLNGIPVVQIELKTLEVSPRRAIEQIVEYKNDSGNGYTNSLLCFMQLFIVSNESNTYYFANNQNQHFSFNADERFLPIYQLASEDNKKITHLHSFAEKFLTKCTLGQMISRYMVLVATEQKMMIMRPYQIYAVKAIVDCIQQNRGNGYIWHTTGSGKTLTSFKASTLLKDNPDVDKCLFVVDRKDLDRQTREEFNKFQENCVEENTNTETLVQRLLSDDYANKVIVTTIQKLGLALNENSKRNINKKEAGKVTYKERLEPLSDKRIVFIFDECHRSQFGDNHQAIKEFFPNAQLFGFTGTPIFDDNAAYIKVEGEEGSYKTTEDIFEKELHKYTITDAIDDGNVLRFHVDYFKPEEEVASKLKNAFTHKAVVKAILGKHDTATHSQRFNALLATASINDAIDYFKLFKEAQSEFKAEDESYEPLNIACVFSPPAEGNKDVQQLQEDLPQEKADNEEEPAKKKKALVEIMSDYNSQYGTNHSISEFDNYYQDVQKRIKDHQYSNTDYPRENKIDILIVVDMLLTGFDSKYLNTLYVDKNLKYHGLIQAFSRTNRVLNNTKPYGNIVDFREQETAVDDAIKLFSGKDTKKTAKEIWLVDPAPEVIEKFEGALNTLEKFMRSQGLAFAPEQVSNLKGDNARGEFVAQFKEVQRLKTQIDQYTDLSEDHKASIEKLMPTDNMRAFKSMYLETAQVLKKVQDKGTEDDIVQNLDFEFVLFSSAVIDYDYIMGLIAKYTHNEPSKEKMTREELVDILSSSSNLMDERDDIVAYIKSLKIGNGLSEKDIHEGYQTFKAERSVVEVSSMAKTYGLEAKALQDFVDGIMDRMVFDGEQLTDLLAPLDLGWKERRVKELELMEELVPLLKRLAQSREISGLAAYE